MDDGDAGPQSLYVAVSWGVVAPYYSSIIQLETPEVHNHEYASSPIETKFSTEFSAHIARIPRLLQRPISWAISLPPESSTDDLYMLPSCDFEKSEIENIGKLPGFSFNLRTKKCKIIKASLAPKYIGHVVTMGDHIYYIAQPYSGTNSPYPRFERYDTLSQSWEERKPLPLYMYTEPDSPPRIRGLTSPCTRTELGLILGTAVLDDTILIILEGCTMWAYNVGRDKWYLVTVSNDMCYDIDGVAVVLNKIIYVTGKFCESIVAMTLKSHESEDDLVYTCDLLKAYVVPGIEQVKYDLRDSYEWAKRLVHLGKDNFCVVQSCNRFGLTENQYIQVTYIKVSDEKSTMTNICLHEFKLPLGHEFTISHCFFMPKCKTTALKEGNRLLKLNPEHEAEIVTLPPELIQISQSGDGADTTPQVQEDVPKKSYASVVAGNSIVPTKAGTVSEHQSINYATKAGDGHSVLVTNLPPDILKVYKGLKSFGPIKNFVMHGGRNNTSEYFADVEFESATSKQNAIKSSPIEIGDRLAVIEEKRGTGLTQGGSVSQTRQRDDVDTTPQVQEDVPKKSSTSVAADKSNLPTKVSTMTGSKSLNYATKASTLGGCHSICVTNLPPNTNDRQLLKRLKRFGPIKSVRIQTYSNNMMSECSADVEFENATSKKNAIKGSKITIGGRIAVIEEKRGTGLTRDLVSNKSGGMLFQGDSTSSKTSMNKLKNYVKDSRFKTRI